MNSEQIEAISRLDIPVLTGMDQESRLSGSYQMIADLEKLSKKDGCIAAGWAILVISFLVDSMESKEEVKAEEDPKPKMVLDFLEPFIEQIDDYLIVNHGFTLFERVPELWEDYDD